MACSSTGKRLLDSPERTQDTPTKVARNDLIEDSQDEDQPWILVQRRKKAPPKNTETTSPPTHYPHTKFKLRTWNGHANSYQAIKSMEREHPALKIRVRLNLEGLYIIQPVDIKSEEVLQRISKDTPGLESLDPNTRETKAIVMNYPAGQVLDPLTEHESITSAERCTAGREKMQTKQVLITFQGPLPDHINLGAFGRYKIRRYQKEPIRCYKCQRFGHHISRCTYTTRCGVCSQEHETEVCITKHKNGEHTNARCVNCRQKHHVWFPKCPERLRHIKGHQPAQRRTRKNLPYNRKENPQHPPPPTPRQQQQKLTAANPRQGNTRDTVRHTPKQQDRRTPNRTPKPAQTKYQRTPKKKRSSTGRRQNSPSQQQQQQQTCAAPKTHEQQNKEPWSLIRSNSYQDAVTISRSDLNEAIAKIVEGLSAIFTLDSSTLKDAVDQILKSALGVQPPKAQTNLNRLYSQMAAPSSSQHSNRDPRLNRMNTESSDDDDLPSLPSLQ